MATSQTLTISYLMTPVHTENLDDTSCVSNDSVEDSSCTLTSRLTCESLTYSDSPHIYLFRFFTQIVIELVDSHSTQR